MCNVARSEREEVGLWEKESKIDDGERKGQIKKPIKERNKTKTKQC